MVLDEYGVLLPRNDTVGAHLLPHTYGHHDREPVSRGKEIGVTHKGEAL